MAFAGVWLPRRRRAGLLHGGTVPPAPDHGCDDSRALAGEPPKGTPRILARGLGRPAWSRWPTPRQSGEVPNPAGVELPLFGEAGQVCPPARAGLVADAVQVGVDGTYAELQQLRDVLVGLPASHQLEDLPLPLGDPDGRLE